MSASALTGESRNSKIHVQVNKKTLKNIRNIINCKLENDCCTDLIILVRIFSTQLTIKFSKRNQSVHTTKIAQTMTDE